MWYPADMSDLHVGHAMHDLCKINSYYEEGPLFSVSNSVQNNECSPETGCGVFACLCVRVMK